MMAEANNNNTANIQAMVEAQAITMPKIVEQAQQISIWVELLVVRPLAQVGRMELALVAMLLLQF